MKIKLMQRKPIPVENPTITGDIISDFRTETIEEYENRLNEFVQSVDVIDIKTEVNGFYSDDDGQYWTNLVIMYNEKGGTENVQF
ncbi:hypothetical protein EVU91_07970 [Macrococcoides bohemicum]|uniref:hypothetical protein n=1 Tax=Macrococcoides bohemicum TaxID=1903056 RepID=UPI001059C651|nr:hypothetical protein [Macrococcus bohemicus]TDL37023.1 hypothetical protein EVU91_07970 [Macrococcus bohemicus]